MIVWGTKLYGKVDEIEGLGFVATQFGHLFWIPLIPLQSNIEFCYDKISEAEAEQRIDALESDATNNSKWGEDMSASEMVQRYASV